MFCTDTDLLHWEPRVFIDCGDASQSLVAGNADIASGVLDTDGENLVAARVVAWNVLTLTGLEKSYPITEVLSNTTAKLSVLHGGLRDDAGGVFPIDPPAGTSLGYSVRTFSAQISVITAELSRRFGLDELTGGVLPVVRNPHALVRPAALGTLWLVHMAMTAQTEATPTPGSGSIAYGVMSPGTRARLYGARTATLREMYEQAVQMVQLVVDRGAGAGPRVEVVDGRVGSLVGY